MVDEINKITQENKNTSFPTWFWIGLVVFTIFIWLLALSMQQAQNLSHQSLEVNKTMLVLSQFSYNLVFAVVFVSLLGAFIASVLFILGRFFLQATVFIIILLAPVVIPTIITTSGTISYLLSYKPRVHYINKEALHFNQDKAPIKENEKN